MSDGGEKLARTRGNWSAEYPRARIIASKLDEKGVIRNGRPSRPYLPRDPERRRNLLRALGYNTEENSA
jgi:hypothetical protein